MGVGLDLGTSRFRVIRRQDRRLLARQTPTAYTAVEATIDHAKLVSQARIAAVRTHEAILITGSEAESFAAAVSRPLVPLLPEGRLPENDPIGRQVAAERLACVLERHESVNAIECTVVLPHDAGPGTATHDYFSRLLKLHGYAPHVITAAQAVGLAELGTSGFAGVVLCCGASGASMALVERGHVGTVADVPCGGDWIDRRLAEELQRFLFDREGNQYLDTAGVARWKESSQRSLTSAAGRGEEILHHAYSEILTALLGRFRRAIVREGMNGPRQTPLPVICQGGCTRINGFLPVWERLWQQADIDLTVGTSRTVRDDNWTVARGCLIHSEVATDIRRESAAA